ncbi:MAG: GumC family protein [Rhodoblastus sp.]
MDLGEMSRAVFSRLRYLLPCLILTFTLATIYAILAPTTYTATMSILIDPRERVPAGVDAAPVPQNPDAALVESQMRLMISLPVLLKVVDQQHLADAPPGLLSSLSAILRPLTGRAAPTADTRRFAAAEGLEKSIAIKRSERNYVIDVEVKGATREKAIAAAQSLADAYLAAKANLTDDVFNRERSAIDRKLDDLRVRMEAADRKAQDYRDKNELVVSDGRTSPETRLKDANAALVAAQGRRADVEARYAQVRAALAAGVDAQSVNEDLRSTVIDKLRSDYAALARDEAYAQSVLGPRHPSYLTIQTQMASMRAQIRAEQNRVAQATEREVKSARDAEKAAAKLVGSLEISSNKFGDKRVELTDLDRAAAALRAAYEKALAAREAVRRDSISAPLAMLISPPSAPMAPSSPKVLPAFIIAFAGAINLWIVAALVAEYRLRNRTVAGSPGAPVRSPAGPRGRTTDAPASRRWRRAASLGAAAAERYEPAAPRAEHAIPGLPRARGLPARAGPGAVASAMRAPGPYRAEIDALLDSVLEALGASGRAPFVLLGADAPGVETSILALSLAHAACDRGLSVLIVDRNARAPTLTRFAEDFEHAYLRRSGADIRVLRKDGQGEIILQVQNDGTSGEAETDDGALWRDAAHWDDDAFDFVFVDGGDLRSAARIARVSRSIDAMIAVARDRADVVRLESDLDRFGLAELCVALAYDADVNGTGR